ncbi:hypothetical protein F0358_11295 [Empedobacter brevis]|uniref:hypothetical protein n=1 Tax=Empedobacter brevis TaxID=247 RepID=UPI00123E3678|nr:hypothetical protein [Empedobacter brevis]QES93251.1 hypothetical protein F0358_11295 [Empedobacter brevis]
MNKNFTLKCMALFTFSLIGFKAQAQKYYYGDGNVGTKYLTVDTDKAKGSGNETGDGSLNSTYFWTSLPSVSFPGLELENTKLDDNKATISWDAIWPTLPTDSPLQLIKDYKITVKETGSCTPTNPDDAETSVNVKLVKTDIINIEPESGYCYDGTTPVATNIKLLGTPGGIVTYDYYFVLSDGTNSKPLTDSVVLNKDNGGQEIAIIPTATTVEIVVTITKISFESKTADNPNLEKDYIKSVNGIDITFNKGIIPNNNVIKVPVGSTPKVSPIEF